MIRLVWLFVALLLGTVPGYFSRELMVPDPFPFMDFLEGDAIAKTTYVNMICDFIATIIYSWVLYDVIKSVAIFGLFVLSIGDLFDYLLCYNVIWVMIDDVNLYWWVIDIPISYNVVRYILFIWLMVYEWNQSKNIGRL